MLFARQTGSRFLVRMEDLDPAVSSRAHEVEQLADLAAIGLDWDGPVVRQSERRDAHDEAIAALARNDLVYECYCTRREIREAAAAPHVIEGAYPGTCRDLTGAQRQQRAGEGRPPALRLRAGEQRVTVRDRLAGAITATVDDFVVRRNDGVPAYNLAVVVDDAFQGVEEVVRGDDLLTSTPRQVLLARLLGVPAPAYAHVPLVVGLDGARLAKRHGAVTLADRAAVGEDPSVVRGHLTASLGLTAPGEVLTPAQLLDRFDPDRLPHHPWTFGA